MSLAQLFYLKESIRKRVRRRVRQNTPPRTSQFTMEPLENRLLLSMTPVAADLTSVLPNATNLEPTAITQAAAPNQTVSFQLDYQDTGSGAGTTGLGLRIHYNSNQLRPGEAGPDSQFGTGDDVAVLTNLFGGAASTLKIGPQDQADTSNFDGDASTDRFVLMSWADFSGQFPKGPAALFTSNWTTTADFSGTTVNFTTSSRPPGRGLNATSADITLGETNQSPVLGAIGNRTVDEGTALTFTINATDADVPANTLTFSASGLPTGATFDPTTRTFSWTPTESQGSNTFTGIIFTVDDGQGGTDSETISITVNEVNQAPVLGTIGNKTVTVGQPLTFTVTATDADVPANSLTFSATTLPPGASFDATTGLFSWTPGQVGETNLIFTVQDNGTPSLSDSEAVNITVRAQPNQAPVANTDTYSTSEDTVLVITSPGLLGNDTDANNDALTAIPVTGPTHGIISLDTDGRLTYTPDLNFNGADSFTYKANDGTADSNVATVNVTVTAVNDAPVVLTDSYSTSEDEALVITGPGVLTNDVDVDGNPLAAVLVSGPAHGTLTLNASGGFTYTPTANFNGTDSFTYKANDGTVDSNVATVNVTVTLLNDAPVLEVIGNKTVQVGQALTFTINATDADVPANVLTFSASGLPTGATFDPTTRTFSWTPTVVQVGNSGVTFTVNDGQGGTDSETITIGVTTVSNANPVLGTIGNRTVDEGQALTFTLSATDADSPTQPLVFSASGLPLGATFDPTTRTFSWTPTEAQGPNTFTGLTFTVNDGQGGTDSETISITVNQVNQAPVLGTIGNKTVQVGQNLTFTISATDADVPVNALTFSASGLPTGATFDATTRTFSWTPSAGQLGDAEVSFTVQDDGSPQLSDSETITINVTPIPNRNPVADDDTYTIGQDQVLNIDAPGVLEGDTDADGDTLSVIATDSAGLQGEVLQVTDGSFIFTPTAGFTGTTSYRYTVGDLVGGTDTGTVTITVEPVDVAPTVTINQAGGQADPTSTSPILFDVVFSEAVTGFDATDVSFAGSTAGGTLQANVTGSGSTYQVAVSGMTSSGEVVASLGPGAATDSGGKGSAASTSTDNTVTFTGVDDEAPTVRMEQGGAQEDPTSQSPIWFDVTFSEAVTGFGPEDISFAGSTVSGQLTAEVLGSGSTYLVLVSGMTSSGLVVASVLPGAATDAAGNPNSASTGPDNGVTFVVNNAAPIVNSVGTILEENSVAGTEVGFVSATDPDPGQALTFSILSGNDHGAFAIDGSSGRITVANSAVLDFEKTAHFTLTVQALDNGVPALSASNTFDIQLVDVNEAPNLTAPATKKNLENTTTVATVTANDPDAGATLSFTLSGTDAAKFRLDGTGSTRTLRFVNAPDFERPTDAGRNNVYNVTVTVSDGTLSESKSIVVTVTDVREGGSKPYVINGTKRGDEIIVKERNDGRISVTINHKTSEVHLRSGQELQVFGLDGNDRVVLDGLKRTVLVDGGAGHDTIDASRVIRPQSSLVLRGGSGQDVLVGGFGKDRLEGGDGKDVLAGNKGNDRLLGGNANDLLIGGLGDDVLEGNNGDDALLGGPGRDSLYGGQGKDTLIGGREDARLDGGPGSDLVLKLDRDAQAPGTQRKLLSSQPAWIRQFVG